MDHEKNAQSCMSCIDMMHGSYEGTYESHSPHMNDPVDPKTTILNWDTGASFGLTPFWSAFIYSVKCKIPIQDDTKINKAIGIGTTLHKFTNVKGLPVYLTCIWYHLSKTDACLFSRQTCHQIDNCIRMLLEISTIDIQIVREKHNLPVVFDSFVSMSAK
jgi:hypothetical protein